MSSLKINQFDQTTIQTLGTVSVLWAGNDRTNIGLSSIKSHRQWTAVCGEGIKEARLIESEMKRKAV